MSRVLNREFVLCQIENDENYKAVGGKKGGSRSFLKSSFGRTLLASQSRRRAIVTSGVSVAPSGTRSQNHSTSTTVSVPSSISSTIRLRKNPAPPSGREICGRLVSQGYWFTRTNASTHLVAAVLLVSSQGKLASSNVLGLR